MSSVKNLIEGIINQILTNTPELWIDLSGNYLRELGGPAAHLYSAFYVKDARRARPDSNLLPFDECIVLNPAKLGQDLNSPFLARVLFHELGHATGRVERMNRPSLYRAGAHDKKSHLAIRDVEELIAERIAQKCCEHFGIIDENNRIRSIRYIDMYSADLELSEIEGAHLERDAERGFRYILQTWAPQTETVKKAA